MATRSTIAIMHKDGTIQSVYAHWDGYISNNGVVLFQHYQDVKKIKKLISLGAISVLAEEVAIPKGAKHNFDAPLEGITLFYQRDRGDDPFGPYQFKDLEEYLIKGDFQGYDYIYQVNKKAWFVIDTETKQMEELDSLILKEDKVEESIKQSIYAKKEKDKIEQSLKKTKKVSASVLIKV